ncbi:hypothetical protein EHF33_15700 [Deinococcus psychrotolerans]|uniref:Uncharacterized protein n=1 Tax=Deinococcus psychrotolerans TaxID=2489213 RepID=A0A3G8YHK6_9DEIO|nr:hypothetical protein [Deinococcus psychrotolerans]AZI44330.1 hypothetical protein EHF33_15700 [Deinococcus psychrotolerans]
MTERSELILTNGLGDPLIKLREAQSIDLLDCQPFALSAEQKQQLGNAIQGAARAAVSSAPALAAANTYRLVLSPEMHSALQKGVGEFMRVDGGLVGHVRNIETGKLIGAGHFKPLQLTRFAAVATIAFQVASMVTAQYYLHNINQNLKSINHKLDGLQEFLETQATGRIIALLKAVERNFKLLQARPLDVEERHATFEDIRHIIREAEGQMAQHSMPLQNLQAALETSTQFNLEAAKQSLVEHSKHMNTALFAARANLMALHVGLQAGWALDRLNLHRESLSEALSVLDAATTTFDRALKHVESRVETKKVVGDQPSFWVSLAMVTPVVSALLMGTRMVQEHQKKRTGQQRDQFVTERTPALKLHREMIAQLRQDLEGLQEHAAKMQERSRQPVALVAHIDNSGVITQAYEVIDREKVTVAV